MTSQPSAPSGSKAAPVAKMKFEVALSELEAIVRRMEDGQLPLEESIAAYRRGSELRAHCQQLLSDAEQRIQVLENGVLRDFDVEVKPGETP